ncbi:YlbF family regulator [Shimazuella sp. AN120528]|uniref:RicAFT regulatory complex protein RicA family protein n=1 Tax=Shimazuella soli TaxID=1892854 RepID=UPI001F0FFF8B|nr:YlbF family regulator [Shimazuella soli]MCH5586401.1 YlbF family regulator [Shimazuella soli]
MLEHPVLKSAELFAEKVRTSSEVERFHIAEQQVNNSQSVQNLIETIKKKQKELVHAKHYEKTVYRMQLEKELDELNDRLDHMPIVLEYQQRQVEMNELLQMIQQVIAQTVSGKLEVETGGVVASGCGSGGACGCGNKHKKTG